MTLPSQQDLEEMLASRPSLAASLDDFDRFDPVERRSPFFNMPLANSGFRSPPESEPGDDDQDDKTPWCPPAWRKPGSGWYKNHFAPGAHSPSRSREISPAYESAGEGEVTLQPANVPLPVSPLKTTPANSPDRDLGPHAQEDESAAQAHAVREVSLPPDHPQDNYFRLALKAELQHRTEPFDTAFSYMSSIYSLVTKSKLSAFVSLLVAVLSLTTFRLLLQTPFTGHVPDLVKVVGLAKAFEPFMYYSENGVSQIGELQETGVAVWDLSETVRLTNMTSAPIIVRELDDLSESLKTLSVELTKFFANVDGDVDSILIVMDWAKRELAQIQMLPESSLGSIFGNLHGLLCHAGLLESTAGKPTIMGQVVGALFGQTNPQRQKATLHRTFDEFLNVLEESINNELTSSTALFALYESIDRQFLNLQRTVLREVDQQEREEGELLSSLWSRLMGSSASKLRKYEKNRQLLASLRSRTLMNKGALGDHRAKLQQLKSNLEMLRKRLVSPLLRSNESSTLAIEDQIKGLDGTYDYLSGVREQQKSRVMEKLYGPSERMTLAVEGGKVE